MVAKKILLLLIAIENQAYTVIFPCRLRSSSKFAAPILVQLFKAVLISDYAFCSFK